jgi:two-component system NtrC family response regulator
MAAIERSPWPGNVRQLLNAVKRASIMADGNRVTAEDVGLDAGAGEGNAADAAQAGAGENLDLRLAREAAERRVILAALARSAGNMAKAAELLGVSRPTLYDLMARLSIRQQVETSA